MEQPATSSLLDENMTCEFKRKNSFILSKSCMETEQFLLTMKSSLYSRHIVKHGLHWICKTWTGFVKHGLDWICKTWTGVNL